MKAESIETLDVSERTALADFFIVCGGTSDVHVESIADKVIMKLRDEKIRPLRVEGKRSGWILVDYGDVILHVMRDEQRQYYDLESLWKTNLREPSVVEPEA